MLEHFDHVRRLIERFDRPLEHVNGTRASVRSLFNRSVPKQSGLAKAALVICGAAVFLMSITSAFAEKQPPAMIVPGQFNVNAAGAATYTVPIAVPPGTAGMVPALALNYSSQSGDGIVGIGWTLSGLPAIVRCPRTAAQDSVHGGVNFDSNDKFCMEGQRLIAISGTYGANGTEYRTEIDGFSKVISYGTAGSGPDHFKVWTKAGQVMEFGNTSDSQVLAVGISSARSWAVNKITDTKGNYLTVTYNSASGSDRTTYGEAYPTEIDYTGNASASVSPYNSVQFTYNDSAQLGYSYRPDTTPNYQAGSIIQTTVVLTNIKTYTGSTLVHDYKLGYRAGSTTTHSRLTTVTLCDGSSNCLAPTTFGWQGGTGQLTMSSAANALTHGVLLFAGDFDGDGRTDAVYLDTTPGNCGPIPTYFGSASSPPTSSSSGMSLATSGDGAFSCHMGIGNSPFQTIRDQSGVTDFLSEPYSVWYEDDGEGGYYNDFYELDLSIPGGGWLGYYPLMTGYYNNLPPGLLGDFNGDGIPDFISLASTSYINLGSTAGYFYPDGGHSGLNPSSVPVSLGDFDGDGCTDIFAQGSTDEVIFSCNPAVSTVSLPSLSGYTVTLADFNGDGKTDILATQASGAAVLYLSTGTGWVSYTLSSFTDWGKYSIYVGDFDGDGKADVFLVAPGGSGKYGSGTSHKLYLSTGSGFTAAVDTSNNPITISNSSSSVTAVVADWNSDGASDFWIKQSSGDYVYTFSFKPESITSVTNGLDNSTPGASADLNISYDRLNENGSFYTKGSSASYPAQDVDGAIYVVSEVDSSDGTGTCTPSSSYTHCYRSTYSYAGAQTNLSGRGFLGFAQMVVNDLQTSVVQTTNYRQDFPYIGLTSSQTKTHSGTTLNSTTNTYYDDATHCGVSESTGVYFVCRTESVVASNDLDGTAMPTATTDYTYDSYGNALTVNVATAYGGSTSYKNTTNTYYTADTTNWILGRLETASVESIVGSSDITRYASFTYESGTGILNEEVVESGVSTCNSGSSSCTVTTDYTIDTFGHRTATAVSGSGITTRTSGVSFDSLGEFQTSASNPLSQSESWTYTSSASAAFGVPTSHTGPNSLTTSWSYDTFGYPTLETRPDATKTSTSYAYCSGVNGGSASCPTGAAFVVQMEAFASNGTTQIGPIVKTFYDPLSRVIETDSEGFDGSAIIAATQYDAGGRVHEASRPYFSGGTVKWTVYTYDDLGRVTLTTMPDSSTISNSYSGLSITTTDSASHATTTITNAQGQKASVTDAASHTTSYTYDAVGDLLTVTDPAGNVTTNTYDPRGRKITSSDPDMGSWSYVYDVLDELTSQTDAKSQTATLTYDLLGRVVERSESGMVSNWVYDGATHGVGKVQKSCTSSSSNSTCSSATTTRTFTYDSTGRPSTVTLNANSNNYEYSETYDSTNGQLSTVTYPSGLGLQYLYNGYGYLYEVEDASTFTAYWTANTRDAELHLTTATAGSGVETTQVFDPNTGLAEQIRAGTSDSVANLSYVFDTVGRLTSRADTIEGYTEYFCYDSLNRLINYAVGSSCTSAGGSYTAKTVGYDSASVGNITSKTGVGTYSYPSAGSARPHGVASISGTVNGVTNPNYHYDGNGNLDCIYTGSYPSGCSGGGASESISYKPFNMADTITRGSTTVSFTYDSEHQRLTQVASTGTTTYLSDPISGAMSEKVVSGSTTWHDYIMADGKMVAERFCTGSPPCSSGATVNYFILDHLGSVAVITDSSGTVITGGRQSYDAWGLLRNANGTEMSTCGMPVGSTRGFTGQEHLPDVCLINFNARIYDPTLGRFMSADPVVGDLYNPQQLNRYSYVLDDPLSLMDPSGLCFLGCFWNSSIFKAILSIFVAIEAPELLETLEGPAFVASTAGTITNLAIAGTLAGGVSGGTLKSALLGGLESLAFFEVGNVLNPVVGGTVQPLTLFGSQTAAEFVAHGFVGGIFSSASGGSFESGFLAAGFGSFAPTPAAGEDFGEVVVGTAESAVLGGAGSVLGGGKFANGAITGAFGYLFNDFFHATDFGNDAHSTLLNKATGSGAEFFGNTWWASDGSAWFGGRPDLGDTILRDLWELKPFNIRELTDGEAQVEYYSFMSSLGPTEYQPGASAPSFFNGSTLTLPGKLAVYSYTFVGSGVIGYTYQANEGNRLVPWYIPAPAFRSTPKVAPEGVPFEGLGGFDPIPVPP